MKTITPKATRHRRWVLICAGVICALAVPIASTLSDLARALGTTCASTKPDCGGPVPLCAEVVDSQGAFGYYVGHDENEVAFYSTTPGSGNHMRYQLTLPREPRGRFSPSNSYTFQLGSVFWFGMALCDTQSYPEQTAQCPADSDSNVVDPAQDPTSVPGSAFFELQFYAPGWAPAFAGVSCDPTKWCAALQINSWSQNPINGDALNNTCQSEILGGIEYTNYAYLTLDGKPLGPRIHFSSTRAPLATRRTRTRCSSARAIKQL